MMSSIALGLFSWTIWSALAWMSAAAGMRGTARACTVFACIQGIALAFLVLMQVLQ